MHMKYIFTEAKVYIKYVLKLKICKIISKKQSNMYVYRKVFYVVKINTNKTVTRDNRINSQAKTTFVYIFQVEIV